MSEPDRSQPLEESAALAEWLGSHLPGFRRPFTARKFPGGQSNPTYLVETGAAKWVLRRQPPGSLLASAHAVDREFRVTAALAQIGFPVARPIALCTDRDVIGSLFFVMAYQPGRIFWDPALPELAPSERAACMVSAVDALIALAQVDTDAVGLADFGRPGNYYARQVSRWETQYRASETGTLVPMDALIQALPAVLPQDQGARALVHGDFRLDNLVFDADRPSLQAVLDWELSTLGDPLSDLSYFCMALRLPRNPVLPGLGGIDRAGLGVPTEQAMLARFAAGTGIDPEPHWPALIAFQYFRLASIAQGVKRRALDGNASSARAHEAGAMVEVLARAGCECLDAGVT